MFAMLSVLDLWYLSELSVQQRLLGIAKYEASYV